MIEDVFNFDDFLNNNSKGVSSIPLTEKKEEIKSEGIIEKKLTEKSVEDENSNENSNENKKDKEEVKSNIQEDDQNEEYEEEYESPSKPIKEKSFIDKEEDDDYYKIYSDKSEEFICDISIEGADPEETEARIIIESDDWTLQFSGELRNGKCYIPIKKLNILKEGQVGKIKLEVIAEGNLFVPWEDKFKVKLSKKVTVKVNEQKSNSNISKKSTGVRVSVNR
jgi:hypothetical protein